MARSEFPHGIIFEYLAEGAANIVYKFVLSPSPTSSDDEEETPPTSGLRTPPAVDDPSFFKGVLLRARKDVPCAASYEELTEYFTEKIKPLFDENELVQQDLVTLPKGFAAPTNAWLKSQESTNKRPKKRHGVYLATDEPHGLYITNMTPMEGEESVLVEFKPKWLVQSPTAPENSLRCRTCALREQRIAAARVLGENLERSFCPLDLVSSDIRHVARAVSFIHRDPFIQSRLIRFLHGNPTLARLKRHQSTHNRVGLHYSEENSEETSLGMTLRDCTMYIKVPRLYSEPVTARLGDLDLKLTEGGKAEHWLQTENSLIQGGWYLIREEFRIPGARGCAELPTCKRYIEAMEKVGASQKSGEQSPLQSRASRMS